MYTSDNVSLKGVSGTVKPENYMIQHLVRWKCTSAWPYKSSALEPAFLSEHLRWSWGSEHPVVSIASGIQGSVVGGEAGEAGVLQKTPPCETLKVSQLMHTEGEALFEGLQWGGSVYPASPPSIHPCWNLTVDLLYTMLLTSNHLYVAGHPG